ncbi:hypothetical protein [Salmonella enterica]|uniref:hypothetical protein n=1 Tax=Salmonella enterica TaxID=28901 RepID=UPI001C4E246F|nr:hypothetical protein [Salmonella enterica]
MKQEVKEKKQTIELINDDCLIALKMLQSDSIDLIVTSPPYADQRKKTYGGVSADKYVEFFQSPIGTITSSWYILNFLLFVKWMHLSQESLKRFGHFPG